VVGTERRLNQRRCAIGSIAISVSARRPNDMLRVARVPRFLRAVLTALTYHRYHPRMASSAASAGWSDTALLNIRGRTGTSIAVFVRSLHILNSPLKSALICLRRLLYFHIAFLVILFFYADKRSFVVVTSNIVPVPSDHTYDTQLHEPNQTKPRPSCPLGISRQDSHNK